MTTIASSKDHSKFAAPAMAHLHSQVSSHNLPGIEEANHAKEITMLLNFLSHNIEQIRLGQDECITEFEKLTTEILKGSSNQALKLLLKASGWTGKRFDQRMLVVESCIQALSNLYITEKHAAEAAQANTTHEDDDNSIHHASESEKLVAFIPNVLLSHIKSHMYVEGVNEEGVGSSEFIGAAMLADISGFSTFAGTMCSRGVQGLDDLHGATNGFLADFVELVHRYGGDVIAFAGDALLCVFLSYDGHGRDSLQQKVRLASISVSTSVKIKSNDSNSNENSKERDLCDNEATEEDRGQGHITNQQPFESPVPTEAVATTTAAQDSKEADQDEGIIINVDGSNNNDSGEKQDCNNNEQQDLYFALPCCFRAVQCGLALTQLSKGELNAHVGITYGKMKIGVLGGYEEDWSYLVNGQCISDLQSCINNANATELVVSKACNDEVIQAILHFQSTQDEDSVIDPLTGGADIDLETVQHSYVSLECAGTSGDVLIKSMTSSKFPPAKSNRLKRILQSTPQDVIDVCQIFVPAPVMSAIFADTLERISELRHVSTMFLELDSYVAADYEDPMKLQTFFAIVQVALHESGGYLRQFLVDDKGCCVIGMWGVPSYSHSSNCARSLYCAALINIRCTALGLKTSVGVATGNVFCGAIGCNARKDYVAIGNDVNMAARLMSKAKGRVLIDPATYNQLSRKVQALFLVGEPLKLKGAAGPMEPYVYSRTEVPDPSILNDYKDIHRMKTTILRKQVRAVLSNQLDKFANITGSKAFDARMRGSDTFRTISSGGSHNSTNRKGNDSSSSLNSRKGGAKEDSISESKDWGRGAIFTVILGIPGTGKSTAAKFFLHSAQRRNLSCVSVHCRPGEEATPFALIRKLFVEIVGPDNFKTESQQQSVLQFIIASMLQSSHNKPVSKNHAFVALEILLGLHWVQTSDNSKSLEDSVSLHRTASMEGEDMFDDGHIVRLPEDDHTFYDVLCVMLKHRKTVVIVEDAHYCDELSWHQLHQILIGDNLPVTVLMTTRTQLKGTSIYHGAATRDHRESKSNPGSTSNAGSHNQSFSFETAKAIFTSMSGSNSQPHATPPTSTMNAATGNNNHDSPEHSQSQHGTGEVVLATYGYDFYQNRSFLSIIGHKNCTIVEMSALNEQEVREILQEEIGKTHVNTELVVSVLEITAGNAFWCKAVAQYIRENGIPMYTKSVGRRGGRHNTLKTLIISRVDMLSSENQVIGKAASIIGDEFSLELLTAVLPQKLAPLIAKAMVAMEHSSLISCVDEQECIFAFQNQLIRNTLYDLTPPRDAGLVHFDAGQFIEKKYTDNLKEFYPILSYHYRHSQGHREMALKYTAKAAKSMIAKGAFTEGYAFLQTALPLAVTRSDLRALLDICGHAIREINPPGITGLLRRMSGFAKAESGVDNSAIYAEFCQYREDLEKSILALNDPAHHDTTLIEIDAKHLNASARMNYGVHENQKLFLKRQQSCDMSWYNGHQHVPEKHIKSAACVIS